MVAPVLDNTSVHQSTQGCYYSLPSTPSAVATLVMVSPPTPAGPLVPVTFQPANVSISSQGVTTPIPSIGQNGYDPSSDRYVPLGNQKVLHCK